MGRRSQRPIKKHTLRLYDGNTELLDQFYPDIGHNAVIRALVDKFCRGLQEKLNKKLSTEKAYDNAITFDPGDIEES